MRDVVGDILWLGEEQQLEDARTHAPLVEVGGERYCRVEQERHPETIYHGLWGAHRIEEPLYRLVGMRNGPTIKPLACRLGIVEGSLLPDLADAAGDLMARMTSRNTETVLARLGFRPPSRATLEKRVGGLFSSMAVCVRELESECRELEDHDFELGVVSCGLDRFATRMDEVLPEGPEREKKLSKRRAKEAYARTPPEPYTTNWRMSWVGNVTLYDTDRESGGT